MSAPDLSVAGTPDRRKQTLIAILATCVAYGYFNIGDAAVKVLAAKFHFSQIITFNCVVIIAFMCVYGALTQGRSAFVIRQPKWVFLRAGMSVVVGIINTLSLPHIQLTTFYTLVFTSPFWVALLSAIFLREKLEREKIAVILFCFAVIVYIFRPGGGMFDIWAILVLMGAFFYSCSMIVMRHLGPLESRTMIICSGSVFSILACLPFLPFYYITPSLYDLGVFLMMGVLGAIGVMCIAFGFQTAPSAATVAPYHYTQIFWGALLGYFLFDEVPDQRTIIGAAVIIGAGLFLIWREARRKSL